MDTTPAFPTLRLVSHPLVQHKVSLLRARTTVARMESEPQITFADIGLARRLLGYDPRTPVDAGLDQLWSWYRREVMR